MIWYLANLGNRDVQDENGPIKRCRPMGKEYFQDYEQVRDRLRYPILKNGLDYILRTGERVDRVLLFATDQKREQAGAKQDTDTLWFGRILHRMLPEDYGERIGAVEVRTIREAPNDYDRMFAFFERNLKELEEPDDDTLVYLSLAGGTPACNMALLYYGTQFFGPRTRLLLIPEKTAVQELTVGRTILGDFQRQLCHGFLTTYDFASLAGTLPQATIGTDFGLHLAQYVHQRLILNYQAANDCADEVTTTWDSLPPERQERFAAILHPPWNSMEDFLSTLKTDLAFFLEPPDHPWHDSRSGGKIPYTHRWEHWLLVQQKRMAELWLNAWWKWETGQYADFLARLYRLNEALLRWLFETETHYSTDRRGHVFPDYESYLMNEGHEFALFLEHEDVRNPERPDVVKLKKFLTWLTRKQGRKDLIPIKKLVDKIGDTNGVLRLRNESIIAHGFTPVTREEILSRYTQGDIITDIRQVLSLLDIDDHTGKLELVRKLIWEDLLSIPS